MIHIIKDERFFEIERIGKTIDSPRSGWCLAMILRSLPAIELERLSKFQSTLPYYQGKLALVHIKSDFLHPHILCKRLIDPVVSLCRTSRSFCDGQFFIAFI
jgi:hypothetical protein